MAGEGRSSAPNAPRPPEAAGPGGIDAEVRALLERAAALPGGLALLERAALECGAVLLGTTPRLLERARALLRDGAARGAVLEVAARAAAARPPAPGGAAPPAPPRRRGPEDVLLAADARPGGREILIEAAPECAAVAFGVHPEIVLAAREMARARAPRRQQP